MNSPMEALMQSDIMNKTLFPPTSRYHGLGLIKMQMADGYVVNYLQRRFIPPAEKFELLQEHTVTQDQRLDNITAHYLNDPQLFWRLCDANRAMWPDQLTETVGRKLRITLPEGIPGTPDA